MSWNPRERPSQVMFCVATPEEFCAYEYRLNYEIGTTHVVRLVRGKKMRTLSDLDDEFAAAFQFPDYFGENWPAFDECLADLEWMPGAGYVLFVLDTADVLAEESEAQFATLLRILSSVAREWDDSNNKAFHVLLQCDEQDVDRMLERSKAPLQVVHISELN